MRFLVYLCVVVLLPYGFAFAHGDGVSYEETVGGYLVDVGYSIKEPVGGDRLVFDFNLAEGEASAPVAYERVWVRLSLAKEALFASSIAKQDIGPTTLLYHVPRYVDGGLDVFVRYESNGTTLAETTFTVPVTAAAETKEEGTLFMMILVALGGVLVGIGIGVVGIVARQRGSISA